MNDRLSPEEQAEFYAILVEQHDPQLWEGLVKEMQTEESPEHLLTAEELEELFRNILQRTKPAKVRRLPVFHRIAVAAAIFVAVATGLWYFIKPSFTEQLHTAAIMPGSGKAMLTLADGSVIALDTATSGNLLQQGGVPLIQADSGQLVYSGMAEANGLNTLTTPRGGQFKVVLPDGSIVWLNAASSLQYPMRFTNGRREVKLTGEGYFEIAENAQMPFVVKVEDVAVQVLGTAFNIMAYHDEEAISTTLVQGAVKVSARGAEQTLTPGTQAGMRPGAATFSLSRPDLGTVLAWKNGEFRFDGVPITVIMRQIARWYDVDVIYEGKIPETSLSGVISRKEQVLHLLEILETTGNIRFRTAGKNIYVLAGPRQ